MSLSQQFLGIFPAVLVQAPIPLAWHDVPCLDSSLISVFSWQSPSCLEHLKRPREGQPVWMLTRTMELQKDKDN